MTNSYGIPFDEDPAYKGVVFFDHNFHEEMQKMYKKVNIRETVLGWYTTGSNYKEHDIDINDIMYKYCQNPIYTVINVEQ